MPVPPDVPAPRRGQREHGPFDQHAASLRLVKAYAASDRPDVLVQVDDGEWHTAELREWSVDPTGGWWATVCWCQSQQGPLFLSTIPAQRVWEDSEDAHPNR